MPSAKPTVPPKAARRSRCPAGSSTSPTTRSSPSSKATAPAATSGAPACACSTPRSRRPTAARRRSPGSRSRRREGVQQTNNWLPDETIEAFREVPRRHQGPAHDADRRRHPLAERRAPPAARSLRLPPPRALVHRACPRPVKHPEKVDMVIFRENTEDIYAGIEFEARHATTRRSSSPSSRKKFPKEYKKIRFPDDDRHRHQARHRRTAPSASCAPRSSTRSTNKRKSVTFVHKGNIMKYTEGAFRNWGYALAEKEFADQVYTWDQWERTKKDEGRGRRERRAEGASSRRARSSSRTPSPTSRSSRCSRARRSSTSSRR